MELKWETVCLTLFCTLKECSSNYFDFFVVSESLEVTTPAEDAVELETPVKEETPLPVEPG